MMNSRSPIARLVREERGATLMLVLLAVTVIGLTLGVAGSTWSTIVQRSKEKELLWRGDQIRRGIESYYKGIKGQPTNLLPTKLDDLLKDPRSLQTVRHLRRIYKDPMTGEDFELIMEGSKIKGVKSSSTRKPFKQGGFPEEYSTFEGATSYDRWEFVFQVAPNKPSNPGNNQGSANTPGEEE